MPLADPGNRECFQLFVLHRNRCSKARQRSTESKVVQEQVLKMCMSRHLRGQSCRQSE